MDTSSICLCILFLCGALGPPPVDGFTVTPAALPNPATLFPPSVRMMKFVASVLAPQRMRSLSGKAASQEPSALCRAMLPTGHAPTLCSTTAVSRTCATQPPRCSGSPVPSSLPCSSSWPASHGEPTSSTSLKPGFPYHHHHPGNTSSEICPRTRS